MKRTHHPHFSIWKYCLSVVAQFTLLLLLIRFLAPNIWARQIAAGPVALILTFLAFHLFNAFVEWSFHRYVLHSVTARWLQSFAKGHRNHHALTSIRLRPDEAGEGRIILNRYPIIHEDQHEDSAFPIYALVVFWLLFTPLLFVTQQVLPSAPIYLGGYAAITWSTAVYEVFHAVEHLPYEWWKRSTDHPRLGGLWRKVYGFHHFHHANINVNEAISGFFGLPIADWTLRTYHQPQDLLLHGRLATAKEFAVRPPWRFVTWVDRWARRQETRLSQRSG